MPQYPHGKKDMNTPLIVVVDEFDTFVCEYTDEHEKKIKYAVSSEEIAKKDKLYHNKKGHHDFSYHVEHKKLYGEIPW